MLRIDEVVMREVRLPLRGPFRISSGVAHERRICLLELRHPDGPSAWSECVAASRPNYTPETVDIAWFSLRTWLVPRILGRTFERPEDIFPVLDRNVRGHLMAKAAVEMGFWNLAAILRDVSLSRLLGGRKRRVETGISLGIEPTPQALVQKASDAAKRGYRKIKLKIAPSSDLEYVAAVQEAVGEEASLAVDANAAYGRDDLSRLTRLDEYRLLMIEQPFSGSDLLAHAALQERLETPICLDESVREPRDAKDMLRLDAGRIVNVKPGRVGGLARSRGIHDLCAEAGVPVWCGGMLETGIGRAYNVALASLPNFTLPGDLSPSDRYWDRDVVHPEWTMDAEGRVNVPMERTGLGVEVDRDRIEDLTVRTEILQA